MIQSAGPLFEAVQRARVFPDSKSFPDCEPKADPAEIERRFRELLAQFVHEHFVVPAGHAAEPLPAAPLVAHIDRLWGALTRQDGPQPPHSTRLALPHPYVVPGGRFRESYYWDSYFTALGLAAAGRVDLVEAAARNFADLIDRYGHIPNGNRSYFLSRSQPPFFCQLLQLLEREQGAAAITPLIGHLEREYAFWMGERPLPGDAEPYGRSVLRPSASPPQPIRHTVRLGPDEILNRYWDERNAPREEAHDKDLETWEHAAPERQPRLFRDLRAGAESGWDFSSRWFGPEGGLPSTRTTAIIPVDLNCLLYEIESRLAAWLGPADADRARAYAAAATQRAAAIQRRCWSGSDGWFFDYDWEQGAQTPAWTLAGVYPLYVGIASAEQAGQVAAHLRAKFLQPGGLVTTLQPSPEQWDWPNGWAPLQWVAIAGLRRYGHHDLAQQIADRFVGLVEQVYRRTGKLMEKYNVCDPALDAGGGEYDLQDGFGWTNGVVRALLAGGVA